VPLFQSSDLARFYNQGENELSSEKSFLVDRLALQLSPNQSTYTLPDYVISIRRVTCLAWKLDPLPRRNQREVFQNATQEGQPFWYIFNNIGANLLQLFPSPNYTTGPGTGNLYSTDIETCCIVEYFRATDNVNFTILPTLRRQMLKLYAAYRAYSIDGPGQNLKLAQYYQQRWMLMKQQFVELYDDLYNLPRKLVISEVVSSNYFPGEPVLPVNEFGVSVDEGY
jgi:hypothetical protein